MKALFSFVCLTFCCALNAFSQTPIQTESNRFVSVRTAGIKGGVNIASISNIAESEANLGFHAGLFGNIQMNEAFGFGGEFNYSKQGVTASNINFNLNYLSIPLFLNLHHGKATFQGGGYGAFLLVANAKNGIEKMAVTNYFRSTDYGFLLGLRFKPSGQTFIGIRYNYGLQNINNTFPGPANTAIQNRNTQIYAGFQFQ